MSNYTTEVRFICEAEAGFKDSVGFNDIDSVIAGARPKIFNFEYGLFDAGYRETLETKILRHYYTREIGLETYGLWKLKLQTKLAEIIPYYNQLYESAKLEFNPFYDVDYTREHTGENSHTTTQDNERNTHTKSTGENSGDRSDTTNVKDKVVTDNTALETRDLTSKTDNTTTANNTNLYSDTPQGAITGLASNTYLTNATLDNGSNVLDGTVKDSGTDTNKFDGTVSTTTSNEYDTEYKNNSTANTDTDDTSNNTEKHSGDDKYIDVIKGKMGATDYSTLLRRYRETFLNIDLMVINELEDLFLQLW